MFNYTATVTYVGSNAFVLLMWARLTRGAGFLRLQITVDQTQIAAIRTAATNAGFTFTNITRLPVVVDTAPEIVP